LSGGTEASTVQVASGFESCSAFDGSVTPLVPVGVPVGVPVDVPVGGGVAVFRTSRPREDGTFDSQIWRTDGTPAGTYPLTTFTAYAGPGAPMPFSTPDGGRAVFSVFDGATAQAAYWLTDGTREGTRKLIDLPAGLSPWNEATLGSQIFFLGTAGGTDIRIWRSDGTAAGTYTVTPFNVLPSHTSYVQPRFTPLGGRLYFQIFVNDRGPEIWSSDGTRDGARPAVTTASGMAGADGLEAAGGRLWFRGRRVGPAGTADPRQVLWSSDGTDAGTWVQPAADLSPGIRTPEALWLPGHPRSFVALGTDVFFQASDPVHGAELWKSDGTPEGTALLRDLYPGLPDSDPLGLAAAAGRVWFAANDGLHGTELWSTDGTAEGTALVTDIATGASWSSPASLTPLGGDLYFSAANAEHGRELWRVPLP
jgi:ELWxxDGT repeat protein